MRAAIDGSSDFIQVAWGEDVLAQIGVKVGISFEKAANDIEKELEGINRRRMETLAQQVEASPAMTTQLLEAVSRTRKVGKTSQGTILIGESSSTRPPATARPSQYIPV
jgi:hypothetical protein